MEGGLSGEPGVVVVRRAAVDHKHACAPAPILLLLVVVRIVKGIVPSPNPVTRMDVQVRIYLIYTSLTNKPHIKLLCIFEYMLINWSNCGLVPVENTAKFAVYLKGFCYPICYSLFESMLTEEIAAGCQLKTLSSL